MAKKSLFVSLLFFTIYTTAQNVGINATGAVPNVNTILDVSSSDKGILIPRLTTIVRAAMGLGVADNGLLVYDKDLLVFYFWDGTQWVLVGNGSGSDNQNLTGATLTGNSLQIDIENGSSTTVDLASLVDHDWYKIGTTSASTNINDDIFTQGKVGIGVNTTGNDLEVSSSNDPATIRLTETTGTDNNWELRAYNTALGGSNNQFSIWGGLFGSTQTDRLVITLDGNVGIGVSDPTEKLVVNGWIRSKKEAGVLQLAENDNPNVWWMVADGNYFSIRKNNTGVFPFIIGDNLNTGIGTGGSPTAKLDVNGDLRVRTIINGTSSEEALVVDVAGVVKKVPPFVPPGAIIPFAMAAAPSGYLSCDGTAVSRTTYANLFAALGTTYGTGNGSTTFNLPDLRGEFIRGWDNGRNIDNGRSLGSAQKGSLNFIEDGNQGGNLSMQYSTTNSNATSTSVNVNSGLGYDNINFSDYPTRPYYIFDINLIDIQRPLAYSTSDSKWFDYTSWSYHGASSYWGISRPRNISMNYCIKF